jgi:hypothetical protein
MRLVLRPGSLAVSLRHPVRIAVALALLTATAAGGMGADAAEVSDIAGVSGEVASWVIPAVPRAMRQASGEARPAREAIIVAAGDIACDPSNPLFNGGAGTSEWCRAADTERSIRRLDPDAVLVLGDAQYDVGRYAAFQRSYDLSWGRQIWRTFPVVGNHEYHVSSTARGYFDYFGRRAGHRGEGWYSFDIGRWHLVALNSNCTMVGCARGSAQYRWLRRDLQRSRSACSLAYMHHPLASSGPHGDEDSGMAPLWRLLYRDGLDVALASHDHTYERFAPLRPNGVRDLKAGIRSFVVGTGGAQHYWIEQVRPNSQVRNANTFGLLRMELGRGSFRWRFVPAAGGTFTDRGVGSCHGAPE